MNERIRELAEQAGIHFGRSATLDGSNIARFVTTSDMEKFAELIVRECSELTLDHKNDDYYNGWLDYRDEIKRHFGVEK